DGGGGIAQQLEPGSLVIVMSSIPVETARAQSEKLAAIGVSYIDAPVSGGERGAIAGTLTIMAGGEIEDIERARPLFEAMGRVTRVGPAGTGQLAKLANQTIVGITIGAVAEALLLAEAGGADISAVREALTGGFADSTILRQHGQRMAEDRFEPGAHAHVQLKDLSTAATLAEKFGLDSPLTNLTKELYTEMCEGKARDLDHSALYLHLKKRKNAK
ncbi:MAG: NAD(P)-dependent oxidoreductase, partial [Amphiplicatus sp.]|nr:NAD(P)-dependent oxidoreductase [Amphiplicatus sp.]